MNALNKLLAGIVGVFAVLLLIAATTTEVNVANLPLATDIALTNRIMVLTNATKARLATLQQVKDLVGGGGDTVWTNDTAIYPTLRSNFVMIPTGVTVGTNTAGEMGYAGTQGETLLSYRDVDAGEADLNQLYLKLKSGTNIATFNAVLGSSGSLLSIGNKSGILYNDLTVDTGPSFFDMIARVDSVEIFSIGSDGLVTSASGYKKGSFTGITTTNTVYTTGAGGSGSVTNVIVVQGGIITSWVVTQ